MKHILLLLTTMLLCCCSSDNEAMAEVKSPIKEIGKTLVVYYSYTGNCREIVNDLTTQIEADVLEIQPAEKGLKYEANGYALGTQLLNAIKANPNDASSYPAIDPVTISADGYQNINGSSYADISVQQRFKDGRKARRTHRFKSFERYKRSGKRCKTTTARRYLEW